MEVQLPELETLLLGSLGRRSPEATASRYENSRVEVSGEVKQRLPVGDRCAVSPILQGQRQCVGMDIHGFQNIPNKMSEGY
jgi:hypothetical protein